MQLPNGLKPKDKAIMFVNNVPFPVEIISISHDNIDSVRYVFLDTAHKGVQGSDCGFRFYTPEEGKKVLQYIRSKLDITEKVIYGN